MSDDEMRVIYGEMVEMFPLLPNHRQEPIRFAYYVKLYRYYKSQQAVQE